jgi:hypothetical protein
VRNPQTWPSGLVLKTAGQSQRRFWRRSQNASNSDAVILISFIIRLISTLSTSRPSEQCFQPDQRVEGHKSNRPYPHEGRLLGRKSDLPATAQYTDQLCDPVSPARRQCSTGRRFRFVAPCRCPNHARIDGQPANIVMSLERGTSTSDCSQTRPWIVYANFVESIGELPYKSKRIRRDQGDPPKDSPDS